MRRMTAVMVGAALLVAACSSDDDGSADTDPEPEATETPATEPPPTEPPATEPPATEPPPTETPATEPVDTAPAVTEPPLAPVEDVGRGPYAVGVATVTVTDEVRSRPLTVDIWFPLADGTTGEPHRYTFATGDYYQSPAAVSAPPDAISGDGPFPLVVYSHGSGGTRYIHSDLTETIASHGHVVAAADHTGNTALDQIAQTEDDREIIAVNRIDDVKVVIDAMTDAERVETGGFAAAVDAEQIAVTGHSFGGFTAYATVSGYSNTAGTVEADPRVDAIIPLAPAVGDGGENTLLTDEQLAMVGVPALVIAGTNDQTTPIDPNVTRAWELTASDPHYRLELVDAQHQTFTDVCDYVEFLPTLESPTQVVIDVVTDFAEAGCSPGDMPIDRAQELTNTFVLSFLDSVFDSGAMIAPDTHVIPDDVNYLVRGGSTS